jgi:hypothetical protein
MGLAGVIMRMDDQPGSVPEVLAAGEDGPATLLADEDAIYWTAHTYCFGDPGGTIRKMSLEAGSAPATLAGGQVNPGRLVISDGYLYWANVGAPGVVIGDIRRIAK